MVGVMLFSSNLCYSGDDALAIVTDCASVSYQAFQDAVAGFAAHLHGMGVRKDDRVALWGYNSVNWLIAFFAIVRAGGVAVLVNYSTEIDDAADLLCMSGTRFIVCGDNGQTKRWDNAMATLAKMAEIDLTHCVDIRSEACDLVQVDKSANLPEQRRADEAGDTALVIFTSGTTSRPKAVCISQRALTVDALALADGLEGTMGPSVCVSVPLFHILGLLTSYAYLMHGATVCLPQDYRSATLAQIIGTNKVSDMAAVGAVYQGLTDAKDFFSSVAPHVHTCLIAGGMSTPVQMMRLELQFTEATFINMYGQSEGAPLTMVRPSDLVERRAGTVGRVVSGVTLRIADASGASLPPGEVGEVQARGACLMNGYEGLPASEQAIDKEGWLHTGDIGFLDDDGYLHLAGRLKDVIIRGGENISPSEIEEHLSGIEGVRDAKVMGAPHPIFGESVEACVSMQDDAAFDEGNILGELRRRIPRYKVPAHIFAFDAFPLNVNGKIDQRTLYTHMIGRLHSLEVEDELAGDITVFQIVVKNSSYAIEPVTALVRHLAHNMGYELRRASKLCLAVEEMLTERILDAYSGVGEIQMQIALMSEWMRVSFTDDGAEYVIDKRRDTSMSARIILGSVDDFHTEWRNGKPVYCMDFLYDDDLDVKAYLLKSKGI